MKTRRKKTAGLNRRKLATVWRARASSADNLKAKLDLRTRERDEALEQQTATSEVLKIISSSPGDIQPVLNAVVASAARLCDAMDVTLFLRDGDDLIPRAHSGPIGMSIGLRGAWVTAQRDIVKQLIQVGRRYPLNRAWVTSRAVLEARTIHVPDLLHSDDYLEGKEYAVRYGHRATLAVPLFREGSPSGAILVCRQEALPFTDKQIGLVTTFATQAVIAIENTRLLNELRESLQQQTATSEVLGVISSSPGDLKPVFEAMLANATRLCEAKFGLLYLYEEGKLRFGAAHDVPPAFAEARGRGPFTPAPDTAMGGAVATKQAVQVADLAATQSYSERNPV